MPRPDPGRALILQASTRAHIVVEDMSRLLIYHKFLIIDILFRRLVKEGAVPRRYRQQIRCCYRWKIETNTVKTEATPMNTAAPEVK